MSELVLPPLRVGFALAPAKAARTLTPALRAAAAAHCVEVVPLAPGAPLAVAPPLDALVHKLPGAGGGAAELEAFAAARPGVVLVDAPRAAAALRGRAAALAAAAGALCDDAAAAVPPHVVWRRGAEPAAAAAAAFAAADGAFPALLKPLRCGGGAAARALVGVPSAAALALVEALAEKEGFALPQELLLMEYVPHGGALFKVYVVGEAVAVVARDSVRFNAAGALVACAAGGGGGEPEAPPAPGAQPSLLRGAPSATPCAAAAAPPAALERLARRLAPRLAAALSLSLFNFDLLVPVSRPREEGAASASARLVDANYFPGIDKLPGWEALLAARLAALHPRAAEARRRAGGAVAGPEGRRGDTGKGRARCIVEGAGA